MGDMVQLDAFGAAQVGILANLLKSLADRVQELEKAYLGMKDEVMALGAAMRKRGKR